MTGGQGSDTAANPGAAGEPVTTDAVTETAIEQGISDAAAGRASKGAPPALGAQPPGEAALAQMQDMARVQPGWPVYGSDGALIGPVGAVGGPAGDSFLTVTGASSYGRDMYIPRALIETVGNGRVVLNRPHSLLLDMKLDETPIPVSALEPEHQHETGSTDPARMDRELPRPLDSPTRMDSLEGAGARSSPGSHPETVSPISSQLAPISTAPLTAPHGRPAPTSAEGAPMVEDLREPNTIPSTTGIEPSGGATAAWERGTPSGASDASGLPLALVAKGWHVYSSDDRALGAVEEATPAYLSVSRGLFFKHERYIPAELVASVDVANQRVFLTQTAESSESLLLEGPPATSQMEARPVEPSASAAAAPFVLHDTSLDEADGPTRQPSVTPDRRPVRGQPTQYAPFRSPQERNEPDLDLYVNRAPAAVPPRGSEGSPSVEGEDFQPPEDDAR